MTQGFIFVFCGGSTLDVVKPNYNFVGAYEGIDVANGECVFFDHQLRRMTPRFTKPNRQGKFLGLIPWVESGKYVLDSGDVSTEEFLARLNEATALNPNTWFKTIEEIKDYVKGV
jgi:hypothetical protein